MIADADFGDRYRISDPAPLASHLVEQGVVTDDCVVEIQTDVHKPIQTPIAASVRAAIFSAVSPYLLRAYA